MSLGDDDALRLAKWAVQLESHVGSPQDIEWCKDREGNLYLLQARPLHREPEVEPSCQTNSSKIPNPVLLSGGERAASGIGSGRVVLASSPDDLKDIPGETVLVAHAPFPKWAQVMDRLSAVVTDLGSVAGHFASVAREWRVPTLVGTRVATKTLRPGETVTVDADNKRVFAGRLQGLSGLPCAQRGLPENSPFMNRLRSILVLTSPLNLLNPQDPGFAPEGCKTLHDIVRFVHEKAVQEMFSLGGASMRRARGAKKLKSEIPISLYVLDLGDSGPGHPSHKEIEFTDVKNLGLRALWKGLGHPEILWSPDILHFDWQEFDRLSAGIISLDSQLLASFAVISEDYLNINIRFGYHFVVIDAVFAPVSRNNYISLRFKGGGGTPDKRHLRVRFVAQVLGKHGFETYFEGDAIDAKLQGTSPLETEKEMEMLGFLLGFTRLLDQKLDDMSSVEVFAGEFLTKFPPD
jgi:pyruvate,water dikinase